MIPTLIDYTIILAAIALGLAAGWLLAATVYQSRLARIQTDTWRHAKRFYAGRAADMFKDR